MTACSWAYFASPMPGSAAKSAALAAHKRQAAKVGNQMAGKVDGSPSTNANAQEHGEQFSIGQRGHAAGKQLFARAFVGGPVGDYHAGAYR